MKIGDFGLARKHQKDNNENEADTPMVSQQNPTSAIFEGNIPESTSSRKNLLQMAASNSLTNALNAANNSNSVSPQTPKDGVAGDSSTTTDIGTTFYFCRADYFNPDYIKQFPNKIDGFFFHFF